MARLNKTHKRFVVERLACFEAPSEVVEAVKEEFGLEISRQQVWTYDPTKPANSVAKDLEELFEEMRAAFVAETEGIGIAHKRYRLERLQAMFRKAERMSNYGLAAQLLEQAAKEVGDAFTNRLKQEVTGKDGGPVEHRHGGYDLAGDVRGIDDDIARQRAKRAAAEESAA